jgi:TetR/AcrR family transcriptional regulator, transcriptional repressor for nem operon
MYPARSDPNPPPRGGRPREFSAEAVVSSAKLVFWRRGYEGSTLSDLEASTGLSRSSLYQAYGSKEGLFDEALAEYIETFISPRLAPMERAGSGLGDIQRFFRQLARLFRADPTAAQRGCLWVNTLAEFSGREALVNTRAGEFQQRLYKAFVNALSGASATTAANVPRVGSRARLLVAATFGIWLAVRLDPGEAARTCDALVAQVASWRM